MNENALNRWVPHVLALLRVVTALLFIEHGTMKLFAFPAAMPGAPDPLPALLLIGAWMEIVGGLLLILGLFTRPVALLLSGEMAVAYWMFHAPAGMYPILNGGESAILFCFVFLTLFFTGPGAWSLDERMR